MKSEIRGYIELEIECLTRPKEIRKAEPSLTLLPLLIIEHRLTFETLRVSNQFCLKISHFYLNKIDIVTF
jgi:hypothetical protein